MRKILGMRRSPHWPGSAAGAALAAGLAGALAACGGAASAGITAGAAAHGTTDAPHCGAVITADTTLEADLTGCTDDGLVIGADGITLNLNGHTIAGAAGSVAGIRVEGRHGVTVTGGTVRGFDVGVYLAGASGDRISKITSSGNRQGITLDVGADRNEVTGNTVTRAGDGIVITASGNHVSGNVISGTVGCPHQECGYGISLEAGQGNVIERNDVSRAPRDGIRVGAFIPELPTRDAVVTGNTVTGAEGDGISVGAASDGPVGAATVTANVVTGSGGDGIRVGSHAVSGAVTLAGNQAIRNGRYGIEAEVAVSDGGGNVAYGNHADVQCAGVVCQTRS